MLGNHACIYQAHHPLSVPPGELWDACVDRGVLAATIGASFKLFMLCGFVGWLLHSGRIPQESATVLSQVLPGDVLYSRHCFQHLVDWCMEMWSCLCI